MFIFLEKRKHGCKDGSLYVTYSIKIVETQEWQK
jgi:hypothetical protein